MFHNDKAKMHWSNKILDNRLPSIMTRTPSIRVTKISIRDYLQKLEGSIHYSNKNLDNRLPSILTRLPSIVVIKISITDYLP